MQLPRIGFFKEPKMKNSQQTQLRFLLVGLFVGTACATDDGSSQNNNNNNNNNGQTTSLSGELRGPIGTTITLRNNGADDLIVTVPPFQTDHYNIQAFSFATQLTNSSSYAVTLFQTPANQTCSVYKGVTGTMPIASGALKVGCEYVYDHFSRNTDSSVVATRFESFVPVIGGADEPVGVTSPGYGEGRFVAFVSSATGLSPNGYRQVFWRDRWLGETRIISTDDTGAPGNNQSDRPAISADGLTVVFESLATNLVPGDTNGSSDIFVWSAAPTADFGVACASVSTGGTLADGPSHWPTVSADGQVVAFNTNASNLTAGVSGNATTNVVRRNLQANTNTLVSRNSAGDGVGGDMPTLSEDGNRLAFWSFSSQLDTAVADGNILWDIFVYQHDDGSLRRVSLRADGGERDQGSESTSRVVAPAISGDGRFVAFVTTSTNVVSGDTNDTQDVFVVDLDGVLGTRRVSVGVAGVQGDGNTPAGQGERVALSYDGTWVAFTSTSTNFGTVNNGTNVFLRNLVTGEIRALTDATYGTDIPTMSRKAAYVAFGSASQHDSRFSSTGLFAYFTNISRAWWWVDQ